MYSNKELLLQLLEESSNPLNEIQINDILAQLDLARDGNEEAMLNVAETYKQIKKNDGYLFWLQSAASRGNTEAQYLLANCYIDGEIMEEDYEEAFKLYKKAAEKGHADAANNLADMYLNGEGVEENEVEAVKWFTIAAEQNVPEAMFTLGILYEQGVGIEQDEERAFQYYLQAAELGDEEAQYRMGSIYLDGLLGKEQNIKTAIDWFKKGANVYHVDSLFNLGFIFENGIDIARNGKLALSYYKQASLLGDLQSKINIARIYEQGIDVKKDLEKAKKWRLLAEQQINMMEK